MPRIEYYAALSCNGLRAVEGKADRRGRKWWWFFGSVVPVCGSSLVEEERGSSARASNGWLPRINDGHEMAEQDRGESKQRTKK